jgi:hypothetical protein
MIERRGDLSFASKNMRLAVPYVLDSGVRRKQEEREIFLHIPKCAGTNINFLLSVYCAYLRQQYHRLVVTDFQPPIWIGPGWTGAWATIPADKMEKAAAANFVSGHFPFGVDALLPGASHYITLVRDPVEREVSSYNFHFQRGFIDGSVSLTDYVRRGDLVDNPQTRMLAGREAMSGPCTEETLALARRNLETRFALVGAVPYVHEYICALLGMHGWAPLLYAKAQITAVRSIEKVDDDLRQLLMRYHRLDVQLHQHAIQSWLAWARRFVVAERPVAGDQAVLVIPPDFYTSRRSHCIKAASLSRPGATASPAP